MKKIMDGCRAEWYAAWHSRLWLWHVLIPALGILLFCGYYSYAPGKEINKIIGYFEIVAMAFPFLAALMTAIAYETEKNAGNCQRLMSVPYSRWIGHFSKLVVLLLLGFMAVIITIAGFGIIMRLMGYKSYTLQNYLEIAGLLMLTEISVYVIQYIVSFSFGKGIALGVGVCGSLVSALMQTGLGEGLWQFIPFAWGIRMAPCQAALTLMPSESSVLQGEMAKGSQMVLVITAAVFLLFLIWSSRWQGVKEAEE